MRIEVDCATAKIVEYTPEEMAFAQQYLTFNDPQARFSNGNPIVELLNRIDDTFPSGFAGKVKKAGATRTHISGRLDPIDIELVDVRKAPPERVRTDLSWLRDYQQAAVETALKRTRGIIQMPTGSGKSVTAAGIIASVPGARWLVLVPQSDLLEQFAEHLRKRLGEEPGIIGDGKWNPQRVTVATFQTLSRRMSKAKDKAAYSFMRSVQGLITDECFPAGTLVGGRPIEALCAGDLVPSYDEVSKTLVTKKVVRTFCKKPTSLVSVLLSDGRRITCTEEHPFLIETGEWVPAKSTTGHHVLWYEQEATNDDQAVDSAMHPLRNPDSTEEYVHSKRGVLHAVSNSAAGGTPEAGCPALPCMRRAGDAIRITGAGKSAQRSQLLRAGTQEAMGACAGFCAGISAQQEERTDVICAHESAQPDATSGSAEAGFGKVESAKAQACNARREWQGVTSAASEIVGCSRVGVACRVCDKDATDEQSAECHKVGPSQPSDEIGCRGGRRIALHLENKGKGRAQNSISQLIRVDSVEVHQQTSDGRFGGLCPDGNVYNIEVEGTHTYLVDGVVVHNCHQVASGTFSFVCAQATSAYYRLGISATPLDRSDKKSIFVIANIGGVIHKTTSSELRARGFLAEATIKMVRVEQGSNAPTWPGVYGECVVRSKVRNTAVAQMAVAASKPGLVFVSQVKQGHTLLEMVKKAGLRAVMVWGEDDTEERRQAIKDLVAGKLDTIVCSNVFAQGVDIPSLASVVNAAGGQSVILTLQRLGRATRVTKTKTTFEAWDVLDDGNRYLAKHGKARRDVYENEGFTVEVIEASSMGVTVADPRKDEHGFTLGSAAQAAHRAAVRREALQQLAGVETLRNPRRGKILRPHEVVGYGCSVCGSPSDALPAECIGYMPEQAHLRPV